MKRIVYLIVNFGGPRSLKEVEPFLRALLTDRDVLRTKLPGVLNYSLFAWVAKKRSKKVAQDYAAIGNRSPIYFDTEAIAEKLGEDVLAFHRYLPATHKAFIHKIENLECDEIRVFPMFPQFTYATTGSIARFLDKKLSQKIVQKMRWVRSYPDHPLFVGVIQRMLSQYMQNKGLKEEETIFLFSAHGLPQQYIDDGDNYQQECGISFDRVMEAFPAVLGRLSFQSKFGRAEWIRPYTIDVCEDIHSWCGRRSHVVFVPISFTSDHIETLFEIEDEYMPVIKKKGLKAHRLAAMNLRDDWIDAIQKIINEEELVSTKTLIRT